MLNKYELQKGWHKLVLSRALNERIVLKDGGRLHDTVFSILTLIAYHPHLTIQKVLNHPYYHDTSLSTVKRAIVTLIDEDLIIVSKGSDGREKLLSINEVDWWSIC